MFLLILLLLCFSHPTRASFTEHLTIDTLADGKVLLVFDFTLARHLSPDSTQNFGLFPRTLGQILDLYEIEALDLSLTHGRWVSHAWGLPVNSRGAPTGADLRVWISERWTALTNALSGLFCSSLNFLDHTITSSPSWTWSDLNVTRQNISTTLIHGSLARESVCTENLTPWTKLLPCGTRQGLAKILNGYRLFDANFHSIQTKVKSNCIDLTCQQILEQSIVVVLDPMRTKPNPDWSITSLLDRILDSSCPVAESLAKVSVVFPDSIAANEVSLLPDSYTERTINQRRVAEFTVASPLIISFHGLRIDGLLNVCKICVGIDETQIRMEYLNPELSARQFRRASSTTQSPILVSRYITGVSLDTGTLHMDIHNPTHIDLPITMYTILPWFMRVYLHTLTVHCGADEPIRPGPWRHTYAMDRERPTTMEMGFTIPSLNVCKWQVHFDRAFLHFSEHRPDAHRGFEIGSTVISIPNSLFTATNYSKWPSIDPVEETTRLYTEITQVQLPTPDFSMPYNVITFTSTILAFFFGVMFSLTAHRFYSYKLVAYTDASGRVKSKPEIVTRDDYVKNKVE